ncbi:MAG: SDR family NAD(P)-dependent oxidoreductase [Bacteroidota bacterium]
MDWALIAGGSKGLGFSIAKALAKRKYNLILVARDANDLSIAKSKLESSMVQVEILSYDLVLPGSDLKIANWCLDKGLALKVLCNAAGYGGANDYLSLPLTDLRTMIRINLESAMGLSLLLLPMLQKSSPSFILNVGSIAGFAPFPEKNLYSATKSALILFSYSLRYQLKEKNISVSCLCPGPVFTKPSIEKETKDRLGWFGKQMAVAPDKVGEIAVRGMLGGKVIIVPGRLSAMVSFLLRVLPAGFLADIFYFSGRKHRKRTFTRHQQ